MQLLNWKYMQLLLVNHNSLIEPIVLEYDLPCNKMQKIPYSFYKVDFVDVWLFKFILQFNWMPPPIWLTKLLLFSVAVLKLEELQTSCGMV